MMMTVRAEMNPRKKMKWHSKVGSVGTIIYATCHRSYVVAAEYSTNQGVRVVGPEPTIRRSVCAVLVQYGTSQLVVPGVAERKPTMPSRTSAAVVQYSPDRTAAPRVAGPGPTILRSVYAVLAQYGTSRLGGPGVAEPKPTMPNQKFAVVEQYRAAFKLAAGSSATVISNTTCAVVVYYGASQQVFQGVAGHMPTIIKGSPALVVI